MEPEAKISDLYPTAPPGKMWSFPHLCVDLEEDWEKGSNFAQQSAKIQAIVAETL